LHRAELGGEYGRAITLFPRSAELLNQLVVAGALAQEAFHKLSWEKA